MHTQSYLYNLRVVDFLYVTVQFFYVSTVIIFKYISQLGAFRSRESASRKCNYYTVMYSILTAGVGYSTGSPICRPLCWSASWSPRIGAAPVSQHAMRASAAPPRWSCPRSWSQGSPTGRAGHCGCVSASASGAALAAAHNDCPVDGTDSRMRPGLDPVAPRPGATSWGPRWTAVPWAVARPVAAVWAAYATPGSSPCQAAPQTAIK